MTSRYLFDSTFLRENNMKNLYKYDLPSYHPNAIAINNFQAIALLLFLLQSLVFDGI